MKKSIWKKVLFPSCSSSLGLGTSFLSLIARIFLFILPAEVCRLCGIPAYQIILFECMELVKVLQIYLSHFSGVKKHRNAAFIFTTIFKQRITFLVFF